MGINKGKRKINEQVMEHLAGLISGCGMYPSESEFDLFLRESGLEHERELLTSLLEALRAEHK